MQGITTTVDHPFYVNGQGFVNAVDLCIGSELIDRNGNILKVEQIFRESLHDETCDVYNFKVDEWHTYFVGDSCILVHNASNYKTNISPEMENKILEGQRVANTNRVKGGHSSKINNTNPEYAVEVLRNNSDGTTVVKFIKQFSDGNISKIKKSTLFPDSWSDSKVLNSIKTIGDGMAIGERSSDGALFYRGIIDGVEIEVISIMNDVIAGYPTGGGSTGLPVGFH